jgi:hypothetical protein
MVLNYGDVWECVVYTIHTLLLPDETWHHTACSFTLKPAENQLLYNSHFGSYTLQLYNVTHCEFETTSSQRETYEYGSYKWGQ